MQWTERKNRNILVAAIGVFIIAISAVCFWKYAHYRYQGLDIAIYTNVLWNLSHGNGWWSSIQGNSYLGDHVEPILLLFVPIFRLWPDPRLLIIVQALVLGLTAVPIYAILKKRTKSHAPLILATLWLINPLIWNAALFEFHALAFAPVLLLTTACFFQQRRFWWFLAFATTSVFVREDIALVIAMFGIVAAIDRWHGITTISPLPPQWRGSERGWRWIITPIFIGIGWFIIATQIGAAHNLAGSYKFLTYYSWIARPEFFGQPISGFVTVVWGAISQPLRVLRHLATVGNFDMIFGLLMPFAFLPLLRPKWLVLAIPPALQMLLSGTGGSELVITLHYSLLFIPALVLASMDGMSAWTSGTTRARGWFERRLPHFPRQLAIGIGVGWVIAVAITLGPFQGIANIVIHGASADDRLRRAAYDELFTRVPPEASIATSYAALPRVASRRDAVNIEYVYLGTTQFAETVYDLPQNVAYLLMDARDARAYAVQFKNVPWAESRAASGAERLRKIITERGFRVVAEQSDIALLARNSTGAPIDDRFIESKEPPRGMLLVDELRDIRLIENRNPKF